MKTYQILMLPFFALILLSCEKEPSDPQLPQVQDYSPGLFVLNEGNFGSGNASVSFVGAGLDKVVQGIYEAENASGLGDTGVDMAIYGDLAFIVLNASNLVRVVDRHSFTEIGTISSGLQNPRRISFHNGEVYITNWGDGSDPDDDYVAVYDAESLASLAKIAVSEGPEAVITGEKHIIVAHSGGWNFSDKITFIDPVSETVEKVLKVGEVPNSLVISGRTLYVLSGGKPAYTGAESPGSLTAVDLDLLEPERVLAFEPGIHPDHLQLDSGTFYYTVGKGIYQFSGGDISLPTDPLAVLEQVDYLYGLRIKDHTAFAASASADFTGNGKLLIRDLLSGVVREAIQTGINPTGIYFNP